jgi:hypothetical protein
VVAVAVTAIGAGSAFANTLHRYQFIVVFVGNDEWGGAALKE